MHLSVVLCPYPSPYTNSSKLYIEAISIKKSKSSDCFHTLDYIAYIFYITTVISSVMVQQNIKNIVNPNPS